MVPPLYKKHPPTPHTRSLSFSHTHTHTQASERNEAQLKWTTVFDRRRRREEENGEVVGKKREAEDVIVALKSRSGVQE